MARKRHFKDNFGNKKRRLNDHAESKSSQTNERSLLNDHLLQLYANEASKDINSLKNAKDSLLKHNSEKVIENENIDNSQAKFSKMPLNLSNKSIKKHLSLSLKHSSINFNDVGGLDKILIYVLRLFLHIKDPLLFEELGIKPVRGFLLHGPPGCGKTYLARAIAGQMKLPFIEVTASELVCGISGESENKIRELFDAASRNAPCILFLDEIDSICPKREHADRGMERRMISQVLKCLDELNEKDMNSHIMVIGATNRPDSIEPSLRRGGRFDHEIVIGMPDETTRLKILEVLCKKIKLAPNFSLHWLAQNTPGYVGADLKTVITEAVEIGIWRMYRSFIKSNNESKNISEEFNNSSAEKLNLDEISLKSAKLWFESETRISDEERAKLCFETEDFKIALQNCIPYSKREGFATVPDVTWDDIGALEHVKKQLQAAILWPIKFKELYENSQMNSTKGILLCGPKGCGKTLLAKAIANECSINFLSIKGPELLSMYLGESEKAVRQCFQRAKSSAPCVIFFDEIDALCPSRSGSSVNAAAERVVNQLLTEMDGIEERKQVFVMAATNRPEKIDSAMLRPGRLEKIIYVDIPSPSGRIEILKRITKDKARPKIANDIDLEKIALDSRCEGFSGADLSYLIREAFCKAMEDHIMTDSSNKSVEVTMNHFEQAFNIVKPSVTNKDRKYFKENLIHNQT